MARKELVVQFSPGEGPFDTPTWVTLSAGGPHGNRVRSAEWEWGCERDDQEYPPGSATIALKNHDRLFDPDNAAGTYTGQLLPRVPFRLRTDAGEDLFYGFVEDGWEQTYRHPEDGYCTIQLIDMLAVLEGYTLPGVFEYAVMALSPTGYWPLTDGAGGTVKDLGSGAHQGVLEENPSTGAAEMVPGLGPSIEFDGEHQRIDIARSPILPDPLNATMLAVFSTDIAAETNTQHPIFTQSDGNAISVVRTFNLFVHTDGELRFTSLASGLGVARGLDVDVIDGDPHLVWAMHNDGAEAGIALDSAVIVDFDVVTAFDPGGNGVAIGGTPFAKRFYSDNHFPGRIGHVAVWDATLSQVQRQTVVDAYPCLAGARSDEQIAWALDRVGVPAGLRSLDEGRSIMGPARTAGEDALEFIRKVAATENGALYVDHHDGGKIRFVERYAPWLATRSTASQATFSDDPVDVTAVRVEPGSLVVESNGIRTVINQATVTWVGGEETAEDAASVAAYGPRGRTIDTVAENPNQALSLAQWVSLLRAEPATRVRGFGINPAGAEGGFPAAVDLRPFDLVTYRSQPGAAGTVVTRNLLIEGGRHRVEGMEWETSFSTSNAPSDQIDLFILGTSELDGPDVLAY